MASKAVNFKDQIRSTITRLFDMLQGGSFYPFVAQSVFFWSPCKWHLLSQKKMLKKKQNGVKCHKNSN